MADRRPEEASPDADAAGAVPTEELPDGPRTLPTPPRRGPHPALIPFMVIGTVLAVLLGAAGFLSGSGAREVVDAASAKSPASAHEAPPAPPPAPATAAATRNQITPDELGALAAAQTQALRTGDVNAFLAPYDKANTALLAERRRTFANLRLIPFQYTVFRWENVHSGNLKAVGAEPVNARLTFAFVHQIPGVDAVPARQAYRWSVTRDAIGAPIRVTAVEFDDPQPWDLTELVVVQRPHVILLAATADRARAATWADRAETSAKRDFELWEGPADIPSRFLVFASPDTATFGRAYGSDAPAGTVAFCAPLYPAPETPGAPGTPGTSAADPGRQIAGSRITWNTDAEGMGAADAQTAVMRHEMGHALISGFSGSRNARIPLWVVEGFAEYLEWADLFGEFYAPAAREYVRSSDFPGKLPADDQIYGEGSEANGINYHLSMTAIRYMVEKYGAAKTFAFVVAVYRAPTALEDALKTATGIDLATFEKKWAQWVKTHV
ncbi:peptidase MA family metallohydrolase [Yinghuangia sp. YIM S10712]|uniref:peptidase MA family metallohydrolase n=1 Tax=Yinghuangia sp. YIM S10712 TaxID=3436930 RepID=UPI003F536B53